MQNLGKIIIIVAPSGTGKSTLIKKLRKDFPLLEESVSHTTRPIREGEVHGENYFYISKEEFLKLKEAGEFLEDAVVHSNFYGTSRKFVEDKLNSGVSLLFDLDVQGADHFKEVFHDKAKAVFIEPPSIEELEARLKDRGTESLEVINERIQNAHQELKRKNDFDFLVLNDDIEKAYLDLREVFSTILNG